ncbi:MAG TPA: hypothetical protein VII61_20665, partial [Ktedonobacteraceae bacterium]
TVVVCRHRFFPESSIRPDFDHVLSKGWRVFSLYQYTKVACGSASNQLIGLSKRVSILAREALGNDASTPFPNTVSGMHYLVAIAKT